MARLASSTNSSDNGSGAVTFLRKAKRQTGAKNRPHVALLIDMSSAYGRGLLHGIYTYVREHGPWSISLTELGRYDPAPNWLIDNLNVVGVIARIENKRIAMNTNRPSPLRRRAHL